MQVTKTSIQDDALATIARYQRCSVDISMGVGKTLLGLKHMARNFDPLIDGRRLLVIAPKVSIYESWKNDAQEHGLSWLIPHIEFTTYVSLPKKDPSAYAIAYFDEFQNIKLKHINFLNHFQGKILGLSGTPPRKSRMDEKSAMVNAFFPIVYTYKMDDAVRDGLLNDYKIFVHKIDLDHEKTMKVDTKNGGRFYASELDTYEFWTNRIMESSVNTRQAASISRMSMMKKFPSKERYAAKLLNRIQDKVIVFANTQEQADDLCKHSYHAGNDLSEYNLELFKKGVIQKLSCVMQLSEGINIPNLKQGIIMHAYGNESKMAQRFGRLLRLNPGEVCFGHILCFDGTIDEQWVNKALLDFDRSKITVGKWNL